METQGLRLLQCQQCGASLNYIPGGPILRCVYCQSSYLLETAVDRDPPRGGFVPFEISPELARRSLRDFIEAGILSPSDLAREAVIETCDPVYLPYHRVKCRAHSNWTAEVVRPEVSWEEERRGRKKKRSKRVTASSRFVSGAHDADYDDILVAASRRLDRFGEDRVGRFELDRSLPALDPTDGVPFEAPCLEPDELATRVETEAARRERDACRGMIPGGGCRDLEVNTTVDIQDQSLVYLPLYASHYRYGSTKFPVLINGQNGSAAGVRPRSLGKIGLALGGLLGVMAGIVWLVRRRG